MFMSFGFGKGEGEENSLDEKSLDQKFEISSKDNESSTASQEVYLGYGTSIEGNFSFGGSTYINCSLKGNISSKGLIKVGPQADISGDINGLDVVIAGKVQGNVQATKSISLEKPAELRGDLQSPKIAISDGVIFNGNCSMKAPSEI